MHCPKCAEPWPENLEVMADANVYLTWRESGVTTDGSAVFHEAVTYEPNWSGYSDLRCRSCGEVWEQIVDDNTELAWHFVNSGPTGAPKTLTKE